MAGGWVESNRGDTLPPDWWQVQPRILARDGHRCTWLDGHPDGDPGRYIAATRHGAYAPPERCTSAATDVDHIGEPDDHRPDNLRALCTWHHGRRSSAQGNAARWRYRDERPVERHPGLR